jgi:hypothetical protein
MMSDNPPDSGIAGPSQGPRDLRGLALLAGSAVWTLLNSPFGLFILGSIVLAGLGKLYTEAKAASASRDLNRAAVIDLMVELETRDVALLREMNTLGMHVVPKGRRGPPYEPSDSERRLSIRRIGEAVRGDGTYRASEPAYANVNLLGLVAKADLLFSDQALSRGHVEPAWDVNEEQHEDDPLQGDKANGAWEAIQDLQTLGEFDDEEIVEDVHEVQSYISVRRKQLLDCVLRGPHSLDLLDWGAEKSRRNCLAKVVHHPRKVDRGSDGASVSRDKFRDPK